MTAQAKPNKSSISNAACSIPPSDGSKDLRGLRKLTLLGLCLLTVMAIIFAVSWSFHCGAAGPKPIRITVFLFVVASIISFGAIRIATSINLNRRRLVMGILLFGLSLRLMMIFSPPILEIDLYRYMWDGKVAGAGVSPYRFSPAQVLVAQPVVADSELQKLIDLSGKTETLNTIASRIHFENYSTIYPPVSQLVFKFSMALVPDDCSVEAHLIAIKTVLVLFDIGTLLTIWWILVLVKMHPGWLVAYAWNPLVIKEIANSGHLDSIAVFWMTLSVAMTVWTISMLQIMERGTGRFRLAGCNIGSASALALATASKLFPIILLPILMLGIAKKSWGLSIVFLATYVPLTAVLMLPMAAENPTVAKYWASNKVANLKSTAASHQKNDGLTSFLSQWRMNDVIFSFCYHNARPSSKSKTDRPWFVVMPERTRSLWDTWFGQFAISGDNPAFATARIITLGMYLWGSLLILRRFWRTSDNIALLEACFLTVACFFVLQPTLNPWYWIWAMPFVCFCRNRGWHAISAILFVYYLRFWFKILEEEYAFGNFVFSGMGLFDNVVSWLELIAAIGVVYGFRWWKKMLS